GVIATHLGRQRRGDLKFVHHRTSSSLGGREMRRTGCEVYVMRRLRAPLWGHKWSSGFPVVVDDENSRTASAMWRPGNECRHAYDVEDTAEDLRLRALR
ncbi:MAG TPA: hypothetical protein VFS51_01390, partial [Gemmatimonadales bacterium]|nr:hypothetical protein [Gemmatimonadales bacterium]